MLRKVQVVFTIVLLATLFSSLIHPPLPNSGPIEPYLNGVFSESSPGVGGSWALEDAYPNLGIGSPLRIVEMPESSDLLVLSKLGEVWRVSLENEEKQIVLDIKDRSFKLGEAGTVGMVLHPQFGNNNAPDKQLIFLFYRTKPDPDSFHEKGYNRLSKFSWDDSTETFDPDSEEILIQQYDQSTWHNGGGLFFGKDEFLYLSLGDEGHDQYRPGSTQNISGGLFSGVLRIDVDNDLTRSHPIRRQPKANGTPPGGWPTETYTQGYSIPNDNPWVNPDSSTLEEYYALGIRSPYSMHYDSITQKIWVSDVGAGLREEISFVEKGANLQWPYMEGTLVSEEHEKPDNLIGIEKEVYFDYNRAFGACVIGGGVYRGGVFPDLYGKFLFADFTQDNLYTITPPESGTSIEFETILTGLENQGIELPESPGVTGIHFTSDGQILLTITGEDFFVPGKILRLVQKDVLPDPPMLLSELGVFSDLDELTPTEGLIPYTVNAPLWSDGAIKKRWIAIPNDGDFDSSDEQIRFRITNDWTFPEGTVFIKHFELPLTPDPEGETVNLETRFFIIGEGGLGYGLTYKWNAEQTDAVLLRGGSTESYEILDEDNNLISQLWEFPSRGQCMTCHNANANYILGVKTHQLNGEVYYPEFGMEMNQLEYLNTLGAFHREVDHVNEFPKSFAIEDGDVDLELRIRSYLDANCSSCHQFGGVPLVDLDFRFNLPISLHNSINVLTQSQASTQDQMIIEPGNHSLSELWIRDASMTDKRMPPIGRNLVDEVYIDSLAKWIDGLQTEDFIIEDLTIYPNPSSGRIFLRFNDHWEEQILIEIYSINGLKVFEITTEVNSIFLDLNNYPSGAYIIKASSGSEQQKGKFILQ